MKEYKTIGIAGQWLSLLMTTVGLIMMIIHNAPEWHDFVTSGALLLTIATKVRYYGNTLVQNRRRRKLITVSQILDKERKIKSANKQSNIREA